MKAALDALAHIPDHQDDLFSVDSRSVRVAIEQDALHQALLLQEELRSLLGTVSELRVGVAETAAIADEVEASINTDIMTKNTSTAVVAKLGEGGATAVEGGSQPADNPASYQQDPSGGTLEREQQLAAQINDAFLQRNAARQRVCLLYTSPSPRDLSTSRMPSSA